MSMKTKRTGWVAAALGLTLLGGLVAAGPAGAATGDELADGGHPLQTWLCHTKGGVLANGFHAEVLKVDAASGSPLSGATFTLTDVTTAPGGVTMADRALMPLAEWAEARGADAGALERAVSDAWDAYVADPSAGDDAFRAAYAALSAYNASDPALRMATVSTGADGIASTPTVDACAVPGVTYIYTLEETVAPTGYQELDGPVTVSVAVTQDYFGGPLATDVTSSDPAVTAELRGGPTEVGPLTLAFTVGNEATPEPETPVAPPAVPVVPAAPVTTTAKPIVNG